MALNTDFLKVNSIFFYRRNKHAIDSKLMEKIKKTMQFIFNQGFHYSYRLSGVGNQTNIVKITEDIKTIDFAYDPFFCCDKTVSRDEYLLDGRICLKEIIRYYTIKRKIH